MPILTHKRNLVIVLLLALTGLWLVAPTRAALAAETAMTVRWTDVYDAPDGNRLPGVTLAPNTPVTVLGSNAQGNWINITSAIVDGWVPVNALDIGGGAGGLGIGDLYVLWFFGEATPAQEQALFDPDGDGVWSAPVLPYDPYLLYLATWDAQYGIRQMGGLLDRIVRGRPASCDEVYDWIAWEALTPEFNAVPASDLGLVRHYYATIDNYFDAVKDVFYLCSDAGGGSLSDLNYGVARMGVNRAIDRLETLRKELVRRYPDLLD